MMDEQENVKSASLRNDMFRIWAISVRDYDQKLSVQTKIMQSLREEHVSEYMADFLLLLQNEYEIHDVSENTLRYSLLFSHRILKSQRY